MSNGVAGSVFEDSRERVRKDRGGAGLMASAGPPYYDRKIAEGKTHKEELRSLKRRISNAIYPPAGRRPPGRRGQRQGPGRATGERL